MATATKKATVYPIHELSLNAIRVDYSLQSRVETSVEYMREYSEAMMRGDIFPPVKVIRDQNGKYWLYDGFHRYGATKKIGAKSIRAEVREGTKEDAYVLSAGSNREFSIKRTREDIKKAAYMVFGLPEWWAKANNIIASHIGTSHATIRRHRLEYSEEFGKPIPEKVELANGSVRRSSQATLQDVLNGKKLPAITATCNGFEACINKRTVRLGKDPKIAEVRLQEVVAELREDMRPPSYKLTAVRINRFASDGLVFANDNGCLVGHGFIVCLLINAGLPGFYEAMGRLWVRSTILGSNYRVAIVGYLSDIDHRNKEQVAKEAAAAGVPILEPVAFASMLKTQSKRKAGATL